MTTQAAAKTPAGTAYADSGDRRGSDWGNGSPLVFIHGVGLRHQVWDPQVAAFSQDYRTIAYDTLGHGASPVPPEGTRLPAYIDQLTEVFTALALPPAILIGHSMGALIALGFALAHPERCRAIVPLNAVYDRKPEHKARSLKTADVLAEGRAGELLDGTLSRWFDAADNADPVRGARLAQVRDWLRAADPVGYARAYRVFAEDGDAFVGGLGQLQVPALFLTAAGDPNSTPAMSRKMASAAPHGEAVVVPGERHMLPAIAPEKVNPIIRRFIDDLEDGQSQGQSKKNQG